MGQVVLNAPDGDDFDRVSLSAHLGVDPRTLGRWIEDGEFPAGQVFGGRERWTAVDVAAWRHLRGRYLRTPEAVAAHKAQLLAERAREKARTSRRKKKSG